jgi:predicted exporter
MRYKPTAFLLFPALVVIGGIQDSFVFWIALVAVISIFISYETFYVKNKDGTETGASILSLILSKIIR